MWDISFSGAVIFQSRHSTHRETALPSSPSGAGLPWDAAPATTVCPSSLRKATKSDPQASTLKKVWKLIRVILWETAAAAVHRVLLQERALQMGGLVEVSASSVRLQRTQDFTLGSHGLLLGSKCHKGFQGRSKDLSWNLILITKVKPRHLNYPAFNWVAGHLTPLRCFTYWLTTFN